MANQSFRELASLVLLRCPTAPLTLAQSWVQQSFRDIVERKRWSWLLKRGQLVTYNQYNTGTATITAGTTTVTITTGVVSSDFVGRQFRVGTSSLIATIDSVDTGANTLTLDQNWWPSDVTAQSYSIYQAYVALPSDFHSFVSVVDPSTAQPIPFNVSVAQIDNWDPQRASAGSPPRCLAYFDYKATLPRYELWPHQRSAYVYPIVYESRPAEPWDSGATVPTLLPADVILERAMMYCAMWPGASATNPNPYFGGKLGLAEMHRQEYERRIAVIEKQDNEHMQQNIWYQTEQTTQNNNLSGTWMQSHAL